MSTRLHSLVEYDELWLFYVAGSPLKPFRDPDITRINLRKNGQIKQKTKSRKSSFMAVFICNGKLYNIIN